MGTVTDHRPVNPEKAVRAYELEYPEVQGMCDICGEGIKGYVSFTQPKRSQMWCAKCNKSYKMTEQELQFWAEYHSPKVQQQQGRPRR